MKKKYLGIAGSGISGTFNNAFFHSIPSLSLSLSFYLSIILLSFFCLLLSLNLSLFLILSNPLFSFHILLWETNHFSTKECKVFLPYYQSINIALFPCIYLFLPSPLFLSFSLSLSFPHPSLIYFKLHYLTCKNGPTLSKCLPPPSLHPSYLPLLSVLTLQAPIHNPPSILYN